MNRYIGNIRHWFYLVDWISEEFISLAFTLLMLILKSSVSIFFLVFSDAPLFGFFVIGSHSIAQAGHRLTACFMLSASQVSTGVNHHTWWNFPFFIRTPIVLAKKPSLMFYPDYFVSVPKQGCILPLDSWGLRIGYNSFVGESKIQGIIMLGLFLLCWAWAFFGALE